MYHTYDTMSLIGPVFCQVFCKKIFDGHVSFCHHMASLAVVVHRRPNCSQIFLFQSLKQVLTKVWLIDPKDF